MRNIKLTIEYSGTQFSGWQVQPDKRTVQGEIEKALKIIFKKKIRINGSGRTDSGVHAAGQVANFKVNSKMPCAEMVRAMNGNLAEDITILSALDVSPDFHAQFSAKRKTYRYSIFNRPTRPALNAGYLLWVQNSINLNRIKKEARDLVGKHDFKSLTATDPAKNDQYPDKSTVRTIYEITVKKSGPLITIDITANGFLYKMVRNIVGVLLDVGTGRIPTGSVKSILKAKSRPAARETAPACGLSLMEVCYHPSKFCCLYTAHKSKDFR